MNIAIIGSGNMGSFFALRLRSAGIAPLQIISPNPEHAKALADQVHAAFATDWKDLDPRADVCILAVKDDVLRNLPALDSLSGKLLIHTAGSVSLPELQRISEQVACIWPLYSLSKEQLPTHRDIPLVINHSDKTPREIVLSIAQAISDQHFFLDDEQKARAHLAAVFANNFSNHLFAMARQLLQEQAIPFELLQPLIQNTVEKLQQGTPEQNQTGPAVRHDQQTMERHLQQLAAHPKWAELYSLLSASIQQTHDIPL